MQENKNSFFSLVTMLSVILLVFVFPVLLLSGIAGATVSLTWNEPSSNGNYYWQNFTLNITTDINANCSYWINYSHNGTNIVPETNFTNGQNTTDHTTLVDVDSLPHGWNLTVYVKCFNSSNTSDYTTENKWFLRDYDCNPTEILVHDSWTLGHDLTCSNTVFRIKYKEDLTFSCGGHTLNWTGLTFDLAWTNNNITIRDCIINTTDKGIQISGGSSNVTIFNNTINLLTPNDNHQGIYDYGSDDLVVKNNTFAGPNTTDQSITGVYLSGSGANKNVTVMNNSFTGFGVGLYINSYTGYATVKNNNITGNYKGIVINDPSSATFMIYKNWIYDNSGFNIDVESFSGNFFVDYNQMGNYWGHNSCPGFVQGVDSNNNSVMDRFAYKSPNMNLADQCLTCGAILTSNYTLQNDMNCSGYDGNFVELNASNLVFDCNGHTVKGNNSGKAFYANVRDNLVLRNCIVSNVSFGVNFSSLTNSVVNNLTFINITTNPMFISGSHGVNITSNTFNDISNASIVFQNSYSNRVVNNHFLASCGVSIEENSYSNIITNNEQSDNNCYFIYSSGSVNLNNTLIQNNTIRNVTYTNGVFYLTSSNAVGNITIVNNTINTTDTVSSSAYGIYLSGSAGIFSSLIQGNTILGNDNDNNGIYLVNVEDTRVVDNDIYYVVYGVNAENCYNLTIQDNDIIDPISGPAYGISFSNTNSSTISDNTIANYSSSSAEGILMMNSIYNTISNNLITNLGSRCVEAHIMVNHTTIFNNTFVNCTGISISGTSDLVNIVGNNFTDSNLPSFAMDSGYLYLDTLTGVINISENTFSNISSAGSDTAVIYFTGCSNNVGDIRVYKNNIYDWNTDYAVISDTQYRLYYQGQGNYWGYTSCPAFNSSDVNNASLLYDYFAYKQMNGWEQPDQQCLGCGVELDFSYTLQNDMNCSVYDGNAVKITNDNIVFDCAGHVIHANDSHYGMYLFGKDNVTIRNCILEGARQATKSGIYVDSGSSDHVVGLEVENVSLYNNCYGIILTIYVYNSTVNGSRIFNGSCIGSGNHVGIEKQFSSSDQNNIFTNNELYNLYIGMHINSRGNRISENTLYSNTYAIYLSSGGDSNIVYNNTAYSNTHGIYLYDDSTGNNITANNLTSNTYGINFYDGNMDITSYVYKNWIYGNTNKNILANSGNADYNQQGNYWGHDSCPGFMQGVDSNNNNVVDRFSYKSPAMQLSDQCLGCGVTLTSSYTLQNDMNCSWYDATAVVLGSGVIFDCKDHKIFGSGSNDDQAISIPYRNNVSVYNCTVYGYNNGISITGSTNVFLNKITSYNNSNQGIAILPNSNNITINGSVIYNNSNAGVIITNGINCFVNNSHIYRNNYGILLNGNSTHDYINTNIIENNTYAVYVNERDYITIRNNTIRGNSSSYGIYIIGDSEDVNGTIIEGNDLYSINRGVYLHTKTINANILNNDFYDCSDSAIWLQNISRYGNISIIGNHINNSAVNNIMIGVSSNSYDIRIENNTIVDGGNGIRIRYSGSNISITLNNVSGCDRALYLENLSTNPPQINVWKNWFSGTTWDVYSTFSTFVDNPLLQQGNYWGYSGNVCPGFVPGVDSNRNDVIDRYPYNDEVFIDYACDCGDEIGNNVILYRDLTCNLTDGDRILYFNANNVELNCNGHTLTNQNNSATGTAGVYIMLRSGVTIRNCIINSVDTGIRSIWQNGGVMNVNIINNTINLPTHTGLGISVENWNSGVATGANITNNKVVGGGTGIKLAAMSSVRINNNNLSNIDYGINITYSSSNINITNNDIIHSVLGLYDSGSLGLYIINNYWGHDECPLFLYGRDTNSDVYYDIEPWNSTHQNVSCQPSGRLLSIYKDDNFTQPIAHNVSNNWYYYFNGSRIRLKYELVPSLYRIYNANLSLNGTNELICNLTPINTNHTYWIANCTLIVNHSEYSSNPNAVWNLLFTQPGYSGLMNLQTGPTVGIININPVDNDSAAYDPTLGGSTTDWSSIIDFSSVTNLVFEKPGFGMINFTEEINLLDNTTLNALMDLEDNLEITAGFISLNSSLDALKELNKSAWLTMNLSQISGVNISNLNSTILAKKTLMNGEVCPTSVCTNASYNATTGIYRFHVAHWTNYSVDLTPPTITLSPSGNIYSSSVPYETQLSATTDEAATCKYSTSSSSTWDSMTSMSGSGTTHTATISLSSFKSYTYYVECRDLVNNSRRTSTSFTLIRESSYGGGGASGSSYGFGEGVKKMTVIMGKADNFKVRDKNKNWHFIQIKTIMTGKVTFTVQSTPKEVTIAEGSSADVDVDDDGVNDLRITVEKIYGYSGVKTTFELIEETQEEEQPQPKPQPQPQPTPEEQPETEQPPQPPQPPQPQQKETTQQETTQEQTQQQEQQEQKVSTKNEKIILGTILVLLVLALVLLTLWIRQKKIMSF